MYGEKDKMQYSEKVDKFVSKVRRTGNQEIMIPGDVAATNISDKGDSLVIATKVCETEINYVVPKTIEISWHLSVVDECFYEVPYLISGQTENHGTDTKIKIEARKKAQEIIFCALGITMKRIDTPEKVVEPPIPAWTEPYPEAPGDYSNAGILVKYYFASEAKAMILEFERILREYKKNL